MPQKYILQTLLLLVMMLLVSACTEGQVYKVESKSMEPLYQADSYITVKPIDLSDTKHGDVIAHRHPFDTENIRIKRLIGLPDDTIEIRDDSVFLNAERLIEEYVIGSTKGKHTAETLDDDQYYVLGDDRMNSSDSRTHGPISGEDIISIVDVTSWNKFLNRIENK